MWKYQNPSTEPALGGQNLSTGVTQLRFLHADPGGRRGRRMVPHKQRRGRSLVTGREMQGNLHTLGYFSAYVCAGTPEKKFDLIVDTGSSLTAMPCQDCSHCGAHRHQAYTNARFDTGRSSSYQEVTCHSPPHGMGVCRSCDKDQCGYSVSYTEGSTIRGRIVSDHVWFAAAATGKVAPVRCTFGCQTYESGLFNSQVADGITGMSQGQSYGPTLFDYMRVTPAGHKSHRRPWPSRLRAGPPERRPGRPGDSVGCRAAATPWDASCSEATPEGTRPSRPPPHPPPPPPPPPPPYSAAASPLTLLPPLPPPSIRMAPRDAAPPPPAPPSPPPLPPR